MCISGSKPSQKFGRAFFLWFKVRQDARRSGTLEDRTKRCSHRFAQKTTEMFRQKKASKHIRVNL